jgi:release factor glutamine methyltransferase
MKEAQCYLKSELSGLFPDLELQSVIRLLLSHITGLGFTELLLNKNTTFSEYQRIQLENYVTLLKTGMPLQYVVGETEFCGLSMKVSSHVLIPRPETEELVEWMVESLPPKSNVLDIGTGSGCIAIALNHFRPDTDVWACDVSPNALRIAESNAKLAGVNVHFFEHDILNAELPAQRWNAMVSNPPYIPANESLSMDARVKDFEPSIALFVDSDDPLVFYRAIAQQALSLLADDGFLYVETHRSFAVSCIEMFEKMGFSEGIIRKDISGNDRMIRIKKRGVKPFVVL